MTWAVWAPLLAPLLAVPAARRLAEILAPRTAALLLAATAALLALLSTGSLALLTAAGLLRLPVIAEIGHLSATLMRRGNPIYLPIGALAALLLAAAVCAACRAAGRHRADLLRAASTADRHGGAGDLTVLPDSGADAYALPGRPGRVVVTAGMLRRLDAREREVLLAHERAHLRGRHHLLIICADLAACLHPALRGLRAPLSFHLERWADESAAAQVGDRRLAARAVGRAALAASAAPATLRPAAALAASAGPVPRRVAALLETPPRARLTVLRPAAAIAAVLAACVLASGVSALEAADDLHANIELAQGEPHHHVHPFTG
ncbi:M56 family metallopeptidase [Streptantibioticus rubrisoli]|uniref:M56 family metallopeptidase n=1 Tax=Streptantibioticus rubrisoli TaxID=1387313 RepID=A0ABT1PGR2_9ACTN|nr:M56 family metallopeptidase [Streptantibioticus rubrisoli]MCQ4044546.1 M56 family metallopeptidase [Streptantibioticus rubrisoli]